MIVEFNGKPVRRRDELVAMVVATKPGTTVPVKVLRDKEEKSLNVTVDELNLEDETGRQARRESTEPGRSKRRQGFGITLSPLTSDMARRLRAARRTPKACSSPTSKPAAPAQRAGHQAAAT